MRLICFSAFPALRIALLVASTLALAVHSGCSSNDDAVSDRESAAEVLEAERARILHAAVELRDCDADSECAALGVGDKPCGGHWLYVPYASGAKGADSLRAEVDAFNDAEAEFNEKYQVQSDCAIAQEPDVRCGDGLCVVE